MRTPEPLTVEAMDDTALVLHYRQLGWNPDATACVTEANAAISLDVSQKQIYRWRMDKCFDDGECRFIGGKWRYKIRALVRVHAEHSAPNRW